MTEHRIEIGLLKVAFAVATICPNILILETIYLLSPIVLPKKWLSFSLFYSTTQHPFVPNIPMQRSLFDV
ncbi:MAG TPA: hypothetical protein VJ697_14680 [Nitrososphaeraceae archaeon]|nr:hypothetical protein [Nitrososphaeraceae archaeon]